jgi:CheY-like chemotaxis protein
VGPPAVSPIGRAIVGDVRFGRGPTVLVVDDEPSAREIIGGHLAHAGYRLFFASTGVEALKVAVEHEPDAITLDVVMPGIDGWSLLHRLKQDPTLARIPVVLISAFEQGSLGVELGAADALTKPINRDHLLEVIDKCCRDAARRTVLVVDDDPAMRDIARRVLDRSGLTMASAASGEQAMTWLRANPLPALILLDLLMPGMDGFAVLRRLRARQDWVEIPVVVVTAKQLDPGERRLLREQTRQVVTKGESGYRSLAETVRDVLARSPGQELIEGHHGEDSARRGQ